MSIIINVEPHDVSGLIGRSGGTLIAGNQRENWAKYLAESGGSGTRLEELEPTWLASQGATGGDLHELWNSYLGMLGYTADNFDDRLRTFFSSGVADIPKAYSPAIYLRSDAGLYSEGAANFSALDKEYLYNSAQASNFNLSTGNFSINLNSLRGGTGAKVLLSKYQDADNYWELGFNSSNILYFIAKAAGATEISVVGTTAVTSTTDWKGIGLTVDRTTAANCKIYLNGVNDTAGTPTTSADSIDNTGNFQVGANGALTVFCEGSKYSLGLLIGNVWSTADHLALYNAGSGLQYTQLSGLSVAPSIWYKLGEASGTRSNSVADTNHLTATALDILVNGNMETGDPPTGWSKSAAVTLDGVADERTGGTGAQSLSIRRDSATLYAWRDITLRTTRKYSVAAWLKNVDATYVRVFMAQASNRTGLTFGDSSANVTATSWTNRVGNYDAAPVTACSAVVYGEGANGQSVLADDVSVTSQGPVGVAGPVSSLAVNNDSVSLWQDQSGNGRHLTQTLVAKRPLLKIISGKPAVLFDGVDDYLAHADLDLTTFTVFAVIEPLVTVNAATLGQVIWGAAETANTVGLLALGNFTSQITNEYVSELANFGSGYGAGVADGGSISGTSILTFKLTGTTETIKINGVSKTLTEATSGGLNSADANLTLTNMTAICGRVDGNTLNGYLKEFIAYSTALTDAQIAAVERYLAAKHTVTI